jgi:phosphoribosylaminoimidazole-succinocarboxamide synthase
MKELREVKKGNLIAEGKTKKVFECAGNELPHIGQIAVAIQFKPDITAGDGDKRETIPGKEIIDCRTNHNFFRLLNAWGIPTHYMGKVGDAEFLARRLAQRVPLEVVTRRVATGSILDRNPNIKEGHHFKDLCTEFFYKDDFFHDPMIDPSFIRVKDKKGHFAAMRKINEQAFLIAERALQEFGYQLIDWKQEYGWPVELKPQIIFGVSTSSFAAEDLIMIDEITAGNVRIWPIKVKKLDLSKENLLDQLDPKGKLDKQRFRDGEDLFTVKNAFEALAALTDKFCEFHPKSNIIDNCTTI